MTIHDPIYDEPRLPSTVAMCIILPFIFALFLIGMYLTAPTEEQLKKCAATSTYTLDECKIILTK